VPEVDAGEIVLVNQFYSENIHTEFNNLNNYIARLHKLAIENWVEFIKKQSTFNNTIYAN
jgi:hypothetical protein